MATAVKLMTAEEFMLLPEPVDGSRQELVRGEVVTMFPPNWEHGEIAGNVFFAIKVYLLNNPIGRVTVEGGSVVDRDPDTVRGPDVSFMSKERMPLDKRMDCYADGAPDLCVEVLSPSNSRSQINEKLDEYFAGGAKLVWVVDPDDHSVTIYRDTLEGRVLKAAATVDGSDVLPGFTCPVADFFK
jgi:Uma2 family endonuclease